MWISSCCCIFFIFIFLNDFPLGAVRFVLKTSRYHRCQGSLNVLIRWFIFNCFNKGISRKKKKCEVNMDVWNYQIRSLCGCSNFNPWCLRPWSAALRVQKFRMLEMDAPGIWIKWFIYHLKRILSGLQPKMLNATNA